MKVTKEKAAAHRAAIVAAAGRLFRERGFDGVGVAEITRAAGLTHGGFYGHFASKDALAAEACAESFVRSQGRMATLLDEAGGDIAAYLDSYLSERHRDRRGGGCPMAAHASEIARQDEAVQTRFAEGVERYAEAVMARLPAAADEAQGAAGRRGRALAIVAALVGGMALARATSRSAPELSAEILASLRAQLRRLAAPDAPSAGTPKRRSSRPAGATAAPARGRGREGRAAPAR